MAHTANHSIPDQGKFRRALAAAATLLRSLDYTGFDYALDRIEALEREVGRLREELRQEQDLAASDATAATR